jgi:hypothetical protein
MDAFRLFETNSLNVEDTFCEHSPRPGSTIIEKGDRRRKTKVGAENQNCFIKKFVTLAQLAWFNPVLPRLIFDRINLRLQLLFLLFQGLHLVVHRGSGIPVAHIDSA